MEAGASMDRQASRDVLCFFPSGCSGRDSTDRHFWRVREALGELVKCDFCLCDVIVKNIDLFLTKCVTVLD